MGNLILYFLLLVLEISFNLYPNISYEQVKFSETLPKKGVKFVPSREDSTIALNLSFVLLPAGVDPVAKKQDCKKNLFKTHGTDYVKMIFILLAEIVILYMQSFII